MAKQATLEMIDELEKTAQDFLSELNDMENNRGRKTTNKKIVAERMQMLQPASEQWPPLPEAPPPLEEEVEEYCMKHPRRGQCLIFVYKNYLNPKYPPRPCAHEDSEVCKEAFESLNFDVEVFQNLKTKDLLAELEKASSRDHSDCDALAVVFMSHGTTFKGREQLVTYDGTIYTAELWQRLAECPTLQEKPKLFFIQACRGKGVEPSVGLRVCTDSASAPSQPPVWALGFDSPDILVMQSSYEGMYSFRTNRNQIKGSVFIHFLAKILKQQGGQKDLSELLLEVTRRVALDFEAKSSEDARLNKTKQMPLTRSTLTKKIMLAVS